MLKLYVVLRKLPARNVLLGFLVGACVVGVVMLVCYSVNFGLKWSTSPADWGTFGDYIGGVIGTIFNLLGVVLIYLTFNAQMDNSTLQQFETTFFSLLESQRDIVKGLSGNVLVQPSFLFGRVEEVDKEGVEYLEAVAKMVRANVDVLPIETSFAERGIELKNVYQQVYEGKEAQLDHYFRHLYHIVKYVDGSGIKDKQKYVDIIQAQMTDNELYLALYNGLGPYGKKFHVLIERYHFIENVRLKGKFIRKYIENYYPENYKCILAKEARNAE